MEVLTYDELRVLERKERELKGLVDLGPDFLARYLAYVKDKQRVLDKSDDNIIAAKVKDRIRKELFNARNSFKNLSEYRARKVFEQSMVDLRMGVKPELNGLLDSEKELYNQLSKALAVHFDSLIKIKLKKGVVVQPIKDDDSVLVRFVKDFPEFVWDGLNIGPFKSEDVANLPKDAVKLLISKDAVKEVLSE